MFWGRHEFDSEVLAGEKYASQAVVYQQMFSNWFYRNKNVNYYK